MPFRRKRDIAGGDWPSPIAAKASVFEDQERIVTNGGGQAEALWYVGPGRAEIRGEPIGACRDGEVRVRALYGALSRGTEALNCTRAGEKAVRAWVRQIRDTHVLLDDPLRTKVQSFGLLTKEEQIAWIAEAKALLHGKLTELEAYRGEVDVPYKDYLHDNAVSTTRARLDWLDRMLIGIVGG